MRRIATLALIVGSLSGRALCQYAAEFSSYYSGDRYDFRLTHEQVSNTPAWLEDAPNPPLSARSAKDIAVVYLNKLFDDASGWSVVEIGLVPVAERWVYLISFTAPKRHDCQDCVYTRFRVVVTMDGVAATGTKLHREPPPPRQ